MKYYYWLKPLDFQDALKVRRRKDNQRGRKHNQRSF